MTIDPTALASVTGGAASKRTNELLDNVEIGAQAKMCAELDRNASIFGNQSKFVGPGLRQRASSCWSDLKGMARTKLDVE